MRWGAQGTGVYASSTASCQAYEAGVLLNDAKCCRECVMTDAEGGS